MKGINICGDCALYDWKHHNCPVCLEEGKATDPFYADCSLPDVEEVVHCKDCIHSTIQDGNMLCDWCGNNIGGTIDFIEVTENHFCSYGERKQNT